MGLVVPTSPPVQYSDHWSQGSPGPTGECRGAGQRGARVQESTGGDRGVRVEERRCESFTMDRRPVSSHVPTPVYHTCDRRTRKKVTIKEKDESEV